MMEPGRAFDPYRPPQAELEVLPESDTADAQLATRGSRLAAATIDTVSSAVILLPLQYAYGVYDGFPKELKQLSWGESVLWMSFGMMLWCALHGYFIVKGGQTIGKRLLGIRVVNAMTGAPATLERYVFKRMLPVTALPVLVPAAGGLVALVDVLLIFRKDRRCGHDHVAGTRVVKA